MVRIAEDSKAACCLAWRSGSLSNEDICERQRKRQHLSGYPATEGIEYNKAKALIDSSLNCPGSRSENLCHGHGCHCLAHPVSTPCKYTL